MKEARKHSHHRFTETSRHSLRDGFTAYSALSPVIGLSCHRHRPNCIDRFDVSVETSGPHDFAVRSMRHSSRAPPRPPHPAPTSVTIAKRPFEWDGMATDMDVICAKREGKYF
jgi:hypothetical protein